MKYIIYFIIGITLFTSCTSEYKPTEFNNITFDRSFEADISVVYSKAKGSSELSATINTNVEKAIIETLSNSEENARNLENVLKTFNDEYLRFKEAFAEVTEPAWELHIETELVYQSEAVITIAISTYEFKGGAHGNDKVKLLNLNAVSGKILTLNDIINDVDGFTKLAESQFIASLEKEDLTIENFFFGKPFQLPENIGFSDDGLILIYNVYEIASYNLGYTEFRIPFETADTFLQIH